MELRSCSRYQRKEYNLHDRNLKVQPHNVQDSDQLQEISQEDLILDLMIKQARQRYLKVQNIVESKNNPVSYQRVTQKENEKLNEKIVRNTIQLSQNIPETISFVRLQPIKKKRRRKQRKIQSGQKTLHGFIKINSRIIQIQKLSGKCLAQTTLETYFPRKSYSQYLDIE